MSKVDLRGAPQIEWGKAEMSVFQDVGVFMDYSSMDQSVRTEAEQKRFERALYAVNLWYNHPLTTVFLIMDLPAWYTSNKSNKTYVERGWPIFEKEISTMNKMSSPLWWDAIVRLQPNVGQLVGPPMTPAAFSQMIGDEKRVTFTNGSDLRVVKNLYESSLTSSLSKTEGLAYTNLGWGDDQISRLVKSFVPPLCCSLLKLHLDGNQITDAGIETICEAAQGPGVLPLLKQLFLDKNMISDAGISVIVMCLTEEAHAKPKNLPSLEKLHLTENKIGQGGKAKLAGLVSARRLKLMVSV